MKPIIVNVIPRGMCVDREIVEPYGYDLFYGDENIEEQWKKLEELRETGGVIIVQPNPYSAVREILTPYIDRYGFIKECGLKNVHTKEHGDFYIILFHNPSDIMSIRTFRMMFNEENKQITIKREESCSDEDSANRFKDITDKMYDTYKAKNEDYGNSFHKLFKKIGMTYAYGHLAEKLERVESLMNGEAKVKGESMRDSLLDLANYAILTIMELEKQNRA